MRLFKPRFLWWGVLATSAALSYFDVSLPRDWTSSTPWVTAVETAAHNNIAHPVPFAFFLGLAAGTIIIPEVWQIVRRRLAVPKISVFLDPDCAGLRVIETRIAADASGAPEVTGELETFPPSVPQQHGPDTKWVQIMVELAADAPLVNCEARLIRAERMGDNGVIMAVLTEPVFCTWSHRVDEKTNMTIPPRIPQAANIFFVSNDFTELYMQTLPLKYEFRDEMQKPGKFRLTIGVSAKDCSTNVKTFLFEWGGSYDNISITEE